MSSSICPKCGTQNIAGMAFCSNCGQSLAAQSSSGGHQPDYNAELPPTMLSYQPTNIQPPTPSPFTPTPNFSPMPAAAAPPSSPPKSKKGLLIGLIGCSGLLLVFLVGGLFAGIPLLQRAGVLPKPLFGGNPNPTPYDFNSNSYNSNSSTNNSNSNVASNNSDAGSSMLGELQTAKQVGSFKQTDAKIVPAKDYFPTATDAVQATYTNGSKYVFWTIGKFPSADSAKSNFDTQVTNVKGNGGTIYSNTSKNGTQAAVYKNNKNYYFVETATGDGGSRIHSDDLASLQSFATGLGKAFGNSSKLSQSPTGLIGIWKGTFSGNPTTMVITKHTGETFEGTLARNDGTVIQVSGQINPDTRSISMKETKVLKQPSAGNWTLGENNGTLSENGKLMSGRGQDNVNPPYDWSFTKQ